MVPVLTMALAGLFLPGAFADEVKSAKEAEVLTALAKEAPESVEELKLLQKRVRAVVEKVIPATVNIRAGGQGSGVIISADGYVLTAGHVSRVADRDVVLVLHDGRRVKGKTLGANTNIDSGLIKITEPGKYPFVEMGKSCEACKGQWCVTTGHPGGLKPDRPPVVRLGRILDCGERLIRTDCTLINGDSGGPLFDLDGRVIGIHSRIGAPLTANIHVPVDTYRDTWGRLTDGEIWGGGLGSGNPNDPYMGFQADPESKICKVVEVRRRSPSDKAGLKVEDVITSFDGQKVESFEDLRKHLGTKKAGESITVEVQRGEKTVTLKLVLAKKG
jgi:serine protease Do